MNLPLEAKKWLSDEKYRQKEDEKMKKSFV
jgi:hypothetical protein